jgi:hypothetical protein
MPSAVAEQLPRRRRAETGAPQYRRNLAAHTGRGASGAGPEQEAVMGHAIPKQHPAVVLRSHYNFVRALLGIALVALVAMTIAVVVVANDDDNTGSVSSAEPAAVVPRLAPVPPAGTRFDGGPEEGTRGPLTSRIAPETRYDGGPEEGSRGLSATTPAPDTRYDGGPEEGSRGPGMRTD